MAKIRLNPLSSKETEFKHSKEETVHNLFERFFSGLKIQDERLKDFYVVLLDGHEIEKDKWEDTKLDDSEVLIAVVLKGGSNREIFKTALVLTAVIAATALTGGAAGAAWGVGSSAALTATAVAAAGTSIGMTLLVNSLFPPVEVGSGVGSYGALGYANESSQTYTIENQANKANKFGTVPKAYGVNKMFPNIAANPYTEITTDAITGRVIQNFYCIYSFGYGPMTINNIKIGDTDIETYTNTQYRLVDLNKPTVSSGTWDDSLNSTFEFYKGDNENTIVTAAINTDQASAGPTTPITDYQIERTASDKGDGDNQEIILLFVAPNGLTTYGTNGGRSTRTIELLIEFAEVGTENWYPFNSTSVAAISETTGIVSDVSDTIHVFGSNLVQLSSVDTGRTLTETYGIAKGTTTVDASDYMADNTYILNGGVSIGKVISSTVISGGWRYVLDAPLETNHAMKTITQDRRWHCDFNQIEPSCYWVPYAPVDSGIRYPWKQEEGSGGTFKISAETTKPAYFSVHMKPVTTNQIKVRVTRVRSYGGYSFSISDDLTWSSMNARFDRVPIRSLQRNLFLEIKIQATDQLNGSVQNLSAITSSVLNVYDDTTSTWSLAESSNPAWVFTDLITGAVNKKALDISRLDTDSLIEWADYCDIHGVSSVKVFEMPRYACNFILDFKTTLSAIINKVSNAAGASLNLINGKYGVLIDKEKTTPVQIFTPRNSSGFSSTRKYVELPHALKVKYVDGRSNWSIREELVYAPGYDVSTATVFEDMDTFACTNNEQAWRYGIYNMSQVILRQETVSITVDFENLVCTRGDYVLFQQDVMKAGGVPARVTSVTGNDITIDDSFIDGGDSYGYTFRGVSGISTGTLVIVDTDTATLTGTLPSVGDLIVWGEVDNITINMIVKSITPQANLKASLILIERANAIHDAESGEAIPEYDPNLTIPPSDFTPPGEVEDLSVLSNSWACNGGSYLYFIDTEWNIPANAAVEVYEIYVNSEGGYALEGYSSTTDFRYVASEDNLDVEHSIKVLAVDANGNKLTLGEVSSVSATPIRKVTAPSDVGSLYINITDQVLQLDWTLIDDCDTDHYLIRYSPDVNATWGDSTPLQEVNRSTSLVSLQGRAGSYLIKAVDWNSNESEIAASARTSIPNLFNLNIIDEIDDHPTLTGVKDTVVKFGDTLVLQEKVSGGIGVVEYFPEGYYVFSELLDLGEIYTVRLQASVIARGFSTDDLMSNWPTLDVINVMATAASSDWNVEVYYRSTDDFIYMSSWDTLSDVNTLDSGSEEVWTEWRKLTIGDFTGRVFQFRLKLISNKASITPRVISATIKADMPDRTFRLENIAVPNTGVSVVYDPPFKGPSTTPNVQVTMDNSSQGDYYLLTSKTLDGFTITIYDKNNVAKTGQVDIAALGYGRKTSSVL